MVISSCSDCVSFAIIIWYIICTNLLFVSRTESYWRAIYCNDNDDHTTTRLPSLLLVSSFIRVSEDVLTSFIATKSLCLEWNEIRRLHSIWNYIVLIQFTKLREGEPNEEKITSTSKRRMDFVTFNSNPDFLSFHNTHQSLTSSTFSLWNLKCLIPWSCTWFLNDTFNLHSCKEVWRVTYPTIWSVEGLGRELKR